MFIIIPITTDAASNEPPPSSNPLAPPHAPIQRLQSQHGFQSLSRPSLSSSMVSWLAGDLLHAQKVFQQQQQGAQMHRSSAPPPLCMFFRKVGICRFGDSCSRLHSFSDVQSEINAAISSREEAWLPLDSVYSTENPTSQQLSILETSKQASGRSDHVLDHSVGWPDSVDISEHDSEAEDGNDDEAEVRRENSTVPPEPVTFRSGSNSDLEVCDQAKHPSAEEIKKDRANLFVDKLRSAAISPNPLTYVLILMNMFQHSQLNWLADSERIMQVEGEALDRGICASTDSSPASSVNLAILSNKLQLFKETSELNPLSSLFDEL
ncbi:unnamed protein product [Protopolystoma xenopodis]|uniref:C3H1-type domain-containing protein n=1 Tax=Protopolystoma xenopodis TaxID=117903 RepID=A0A448XGY5_9PLAT|nr:unnamed protein product [Protopolystoma xenopodis]